MELVRLAVGEQAPIDADCISIDPRPGGKVNLTGSILVGEESMALIGDELYDTAEQAEAAGTAWAADNRVQRLYVATGEP